MITLSALKAASSLNTLAPLLGQPASAIAYTLYKIPADLKYTTFQIPKKSGGERTIKAPTKRLKKLQRSLAELLTRCRDELHISNPIKIVSHGFRSGASISTNASQHRNRKYVFNVDLENFFPTFNFGRVRAFFIRNRDFALDKRVATIIAQIACDGAALPQGSPCSPIISDLIAHILDVRMLQLARKYRCTYSRYADDLTFSSNASNFPMEIAREMAPGTGIWLPGGKLLSEIANCGFFINHKKTRMQYRQSRQMVTGLTVNEKVNIPADYYRSTRKMCSSLFAKGSYYPSRAQADANGNLPVGTSSQLEGRLNHIYFIKSQENARAKTEMTTSEGIVKLYDRFLFFKKFIALERPLIICEGKTDSIYLDAAVRHLSKYAGTLFEIIGRERRSQIQYFRYTNIADRVMGLSGGTSPLTKLIYRYEKTASHFKYSPMAHPVIILIDNDDGAKGAKGIFAALKHTAISYKTTAPFYRITRNLYLIKTPEKGPSGYSKIEDLFSPVTLATEFAGKKFNASNKLDVATEYGKAIFAEKVIAPNAATIDFSGFTPLLDRFVAAIEYHAKLVATGRA